MKKILTLSALCGVLVLMSTVSCQKQEVPQAAAQQASFTVYAPKPQMETELNSGRYVWWNSGDNLTMVSRNNAADGFAAANCKFDRFSTTESGAQATFTGTFSPGQQNKVYVAHPFTNYAASSASNTYVSYRDGHYTLFYVPFSPLQQAVANSFPKDYTTYHNSAWTVDAVVKKPSLNLAYGIIEDRTASTEFHMHNACALLKFSIAGEDIEHVDFYFGTQVIAAYRVQIMFDESTGDFIKTVPWSGQGQAYAVRVYPPAGESTFPAGTYYAAVAPFSTETAPSVALRKTGNKFAKFTGPTKVTLDAGDILPLGGAKALDTIADEKSAWTTYGATLTFTMDFTKGAAAGATFTEAINTSTAAGAGIGVTYNLTTGSTPIQIGTEGTGSSIYYDTTKNCLVLNSCDGAGAWLRAPAIAGRRLKSVTFNAAGHAASESATTSFVCGSNGGSSSTYSTTSIPLESAGPSEQTVEKATFPANAKIYVGVNKITGGAKIYLRSLTFVYE